ncbi:MAG: alkylated DNA repair dioxygenase [Paracoccus denitrificans]|nr:MAG: alkylated DNA repair dioxygenase [Paracoccus denitrificans]PZO84924.1 MAG: alkylated DNA repair dioxygenase [Paracoccus denitrificans]
MGLTDLQPLDIRGFQLYRGALDGGQQRAMLSDVQAIWQAAPPTRYLTRRGQMSVEMTSAGRVGWFSDRRGYRYARAQPDGAPWPAIPDRMLDLWRGVVPDAAPADTCLINLYRGTARMGMHQDRDEADLRWPVVSVSLGDEALFRIGNVEPGGKTESVWLQSGDVVVMGGDARLRHHGIDRIRVGSSSLVPGGGRINLTLRVALPVS